jgi:type 1 glutamine amidotransferase
VSKTNQAHQASQILLVSAGVVHPSWLGRVWLREFLESLAGYRVRRVSSLEDIKKRTLSQYAAMVLYFHRKNVSAEALQALGHYTRSGGGLLALHSASASFKAQERYFGILGGRFERHGPVQEFLVQPAAQPEAAFQGMAAFHIKDELYRHTWDPQNEIQFFTQVEGMQEPVVWTRRFGMGRVCYCALGHRAAVLRHPAVQQILRQGLAWACRSDTERGNAP